MSTQPYRESSASEVTAPTAASLSPPVRAWIVWLSLGLSVCLLLDRVLELIGWHTLWFDLVILVGALVYRLSIRPSEVDRSSPGEGYGVRSRWRAIRFQQQCERDALKARRAKWKARMLEEREAARARASDEPRGE